MTPSPLTTTRLVSRTLFLTAYGHEVTSEHDDIVRLMEHVDELCKFIGTPGSHSVDLFPIRTPSMWL